MRNGESSEERNAMKHGSEANPGAARPERSEGHALLLKSTSFTARGRW